MQKIKEKQLQFRTFIIFSVENGAIFISSAFQYQPVRNLCKILE